MAKFKDRQGRSLFGILFAVPNATAAVPTIIAVAVAASCISLYTSSQEGVANNLGLGTAGMLLYATLKLLHSLLEYVNSVLATDLVAKSYQNAVRVFYDEYSNLKYVDFMRIGVGAIQCSITRRSGALIKFLRILTLRFVINLIYLGVIVSRLALYISLATFAKAGGVLLAFFLALSLLQIRRARLRRLINDATNKNSQKLLDVLINYERVRSYCNEETELMKYRVAMDEMVYYRQIYEVLYVLIAYFTTVAFLMVFVTIYYSLNYHERISRIQLEEVIFTSFKMNNVVVSILQDMNSVYTSYFNFTASGIEDVQVEEAEADAAKFRLHRLTDRIDVINLNLHFGSSRVLKNVNCTIRRGEKIAVCGPSSAGKTVFLRTVLGLYPYRGAVIFDGYEQKQIQTSSLLANIGYISQETQIFDTTIMDNLKMGESSLSDEHVMKCCKLFRLHGLFKELGYDTPVGSLGNRLSGGQKQKLVFMRTLLKAAPLLLLDQATSALDIQTERFFLESLRIYLENVTVLASVKNVLVLPDFDRIFYFEEGRLAAEGSFDTLLSDSVDFSVFYKKSLSEMNKM
ncbi:hypothetical protein ECANGB1_2776 [Enterospora canceri]|uniref:ABC transporter domain-containing protein n=1 Tax=Enterospora canceri TaxID=1081671 RepID=A0A1Y1S9G9_9MICR|nr:hypothetical protein ECANGB1_2776 [Enterospora canceri]